MRKRYLLIILLFLSTNLIFSTFEKSDENISTIEGDKKLYFDNINESRSLIYWESGLNLNDDFYADNSYFHSSYEFYNNGGTGSFKIQENWLNSTKCILTQNETYPNLIQANWKRTTENEAIKNYLKNPLAVNSSKTLNGVLNPGTS